MLVRDALDRRTASVGHADVHGRALCAERLGEERIGTGPVRIADVLRTDTAIRAVGPVLAPRLGHHALTVVALAGFAVQLAGRGLALVPEVARLGVRVLGVGAGRVQAGVVRDAVRVRCAEVLALAGFAAAGAVHLLAGADAVVAGVVRGAGVAIVAGVGVVVLVLADALRVAVCVDAGVVLAVRVHLAGVGAAVAGLRLVAGLVLVAKPRVLVDAVAPAAGAGVAGAHLAAVLVRGAVGLGRVGQVGVRLADVRRVLDHVLRTGVDVGLGRRRAIAETVDAVRRGALRVGLARDQPLGGVTRVGLLDVRVQDLGVGVAGLAAGQDGHREDRDQEHVAELDVAHNLTFSLWLTHLLNSRVVSNKGQLTITKDLA